MDKQARDHLQEANFFGWKPAAVLRVFGEDSFSFLQGQFSNDLRTLERDEQAVYGLWLNHKGRVMADSFVWRAEKNDFLVLSYFAAAQVIRDRLEAFVIADDVSIDDVTDQWRGITIFGDELVEASEPPSVRSFSFAGRRTTSPHREYLFEGESETLVQARVNGRRELTALEIERLRIEEGIAAVPFDIGAGELPNEGGLEASAISYTKGCYLGQEVMARLKSMGQVRRRLLRVQGSTPVPPSPVSLFQGDRRIGELRTHVPTADGFIGLALVSLLNLRREDALSFSPGGEGVVRVRDSL
jgi:folate-binding protein YgfZ